MSGIPHKPCIASSWKELLGSREWRRHKLASMPAVGFFFLSFFLKEISLNRENDLSELFISGKSPGTISESES